MCNSVDLSSLCSKVLRLSSVDAHQELSRAQLAESEYSDPLAVRLAVHCFVHELNSATAQRQEHPPGSPTVHPWCRGAAELAKQLLELCWDPFCTPHVRR